MSSDTISSMFKIEFGSDSSIEIYGTADNHVTFLAIGIRACIVEDYRLAKAIAKSFGGNCIYAAPPDSQGETHFIFDKFLQGEIRNPQRLLRAVRNRLTNIINNLDEEEADAIEGKVIIGGQSRYSGARDREVLGM